MIERDHDPEREKRHRGDKRDDRERRERPRGTGYGTEQAIYREHLARRWDGSDPPTPQAYSRAAKLWRQLAGSVVTTATDLGILPEPEKLNQPNQQKEKPTSDEHD
jgi:hypothetical protein